MRNITSLLCNTVCYQYLTSGIRYLAVSYPILIRYVDTVNDKTCQRGISIWHQIQHFLLLVIDIAISISQGTQSTPANSHVNAFECLGARRKCGDILPPRSSQRSCHRPWGDHCHNYSTDNSISEEICIFVDEPSMSLTGALPHALLWVLQGGSDQARDCSGAFVRSNIKHL